jgi:hypothetical protein
MSSILIRQFGESWEIRESEDVAPEPERGHGRCRNPRKKPFVRPLLPEVRTGDAWRTIAAIRKPCRRILVGF